MKNIFIFGAIIILNPYLNLNLVQCEKFIKCCEKNKILFQINQTKNFECKISKNVVPLILNPNLSLTYENSKTKFCIDKTVNESVIRVNSQMEFLEEIKIQNVKKCCPGKMVYNISRKNCENSENFENFPFINFDVINFSPNLHFCPEDQVVVDILSNLTSVDVNFDQLTVHNFLKNKSEVISLKQSCLDQTLDGQIVIRSCQDKNICSKISCVRKCCPNGKSYSNFQCVDNFNGIYNPEIFLDEADKGKNWNENIGIIYSQSCKPKYIAGYNVSRLFKDGSLLENKTIHSLNRYCIERQYMSKIFLAKFKQVRHGSLTVYICGIKNKSLLHQFIILLISCVFLLMTLIVYLFIPELRGNTHGKIVMCNVLSILLAFSSLLPTKFKSTTNFEFTTCATIGYAMNFFLFGAFCWLNVMCFDIFWTFRKCEGSTRRKKISKKFKWYCLYAIGLPILQSISVLIADHVKGFPEDFKPYVGHRRCSFDDRKPWAYFVFIRLPIGLQIISNIAFFIITIYHFFKVKSEIAKRNDGHGRKKLFTDKTTLMTIIKLFAIMGIPWFTEIFLSYFRSGQMAWNIFDAINASQGIFIFIVFVLKRRVFISLKKRITGVGFTEDSTRTKSTSLSGSSKSFAKRSWKKNKSTSKDDS